MTAPWDGSTAAMGDSIVFYNIDALREFVLLVNNNFFTMPDDTNFEIVTLNTNSDNTVMPIEMVVKPLDRKDKSTIFYLEQGQLGPLGADNATVKTWLRTVMSFTLGFGFTVRYPLNASVGAQCTDWNFIQSYEFRDRGTISVKMEIQRKACIDNLILHSKEDAAFWINVVAFLLSVTSLVLIATQARQT